MHRLIRRHVSDTLTNGNNAYRNSGVQTRTPLTRYAAESISLIIKMSRSRVFPTSHGKVYYFMRLVTFLNKQAVRVATRYPPPLSYPRGRPSASRAAEQTQRSSSFPRPIHSHGHRCGAAPASRVKAAVSKAAW